MNQDELLKLATEARQNAHAPFSNFRVGAALECDDGTIFTGCNVENSSYGLSICAERVAIFKAISAGKRGFRQIAVIADCQLPVRPCGACRQVISDLFEAEAVVIMGNLDGQTEVAPIGSLLPFPFNRSYL